MLVMDCFKEDIAVSRHALLDNAMYGICWVFVVIFILYGILMLQAVVLLSDLTNLVLALISFGAAVLMFVAKDHTSVEYEYAFTNGTLDFAKVIHGAKRKELGSMQVANITACGHVAHASFQKYLAMKDVKRRNWFLNRDGNLFYFYYVKEQSKHMIVAELSEDMVDMIRRYVQNGVYQG